MVDKVTYPGSGLVFNNTYGSGVSPAFRTAILTAENYLQAHFANSVTINVTFDLQSISTAFSGQNSFPEVSVTYAQFRQALIAHQATADDAAANATLPTADPSNGLPFRLPDAYARMLGLTTAAPATDDTIVLNSNLNWTYGQDAVGVLEHELSEGCMGRIGSLGVHEAGDWAPMDLFRYSAPGQRDFTGGRDGKPTFFSVDGVAMLTQLHNSVNTAGAFDKYDFSDWDKTVGDSFGPGGPGSPGVMSATDLRVLDILGWNPPAGTAATDDYANNLTDTTHPFGQVAAGGSATGAIDSRGDRDWFKVTLAAGASYAIDLTGAAALKPELILHNAAGAILVSQTVDVTQGASLDSRILYIVPANAGGTYYLEAASIGDGATGAYQIALQPLVPDDYANSLTDTTHPFGQAVVNGTAAGTLEANGDRDWFKVQLTAGTSYAITLTGGTLVDPYLRLHGGTGALLAENDDITQGVNRNSLLTWTAAATGTYYIEAGAFEDTYAGTYTVGIAQLATDDYANGLTDAAHPFGNVAVNGTANGTLEINGDRDWFKVTLAAGSSYTVSLTGNSLVDPYLRLRDGTGAVLAQNDDIIDGVNRNSLLSWTAAASGTYYVEAGSFEDSYTGTYTVGVTRAAADDYANGLTDTAHPFGAVSVNGSSAGTLEVNGDRDWFKVQLSAGGTYTIDLTGGTLVDPYLRLRNATGALLDYNDDIIDGVIRDSEIVYTAGTSGTYYIEAGAFDDGYTGTYTVSVDGPPEDDYANGLTDASHPFGAVVLNGSATGDIEVDADRDWFRASFAAGTTYTITLAGDANAADPLFDPYLRLRDGTGAVLAQNDDISSLNFNSRLVWTATATGTYYLEAGSSLDSGTGHYVLAVSAPATTPVLSVAAANAARPEGNSGATPFTFTVTRSGGTGAASASWAVTGSGANPAGAADFGGALPSGTVAFAAGQTTQTITVNVAGDTAVEPDEGFTVTLSNPAGGATLGNASANGTIQNDDTAISVAAASAVKHAGATGSTPFTFTVTRAGLATAAQSVFWAVTGSGATPADAADFGGVLPSGTTAFGAGETSKTITINVAGDPASEPDEGFTVTLSGAAGATIATASATGTILNDNIATTVSSLAYVQQLDKGIHRSTLTPQQTADDAARIDAGTLSRDALKLQFIGDAASRTTAALVAYDWNYGTTPSTGGLDFLTSFTRSLPAQGFSDLNIWVNLAATAAIQPSTTITKTYGGLSNDAFIDAAYKDIFGAAPGAQAHAVFLSSMDFYSKYVGQTPGLTAAQLAAGTRGCVAGVMLHEATLVVAGTGYANAVSSFYTAVANGNETYVTPLRGP